MDDKDFFRNMGVQPPDEGGESRIPRLDELLVALSGIVEMCATIRDSALEHGFDDEQAFEMAMSYYQMFLTANFVQHHGGFGGNSA